MPIPTLAEMAGGTERSRTSRVGRKRSVAGVPTSPLPNHRDLVLDKPTNAALGTILSVRGTFVLPHSAWSPRLLAAFRSCCSQTIWDPDRRELTARALTLASRPQQHQTGWTLAHESYLLHIPCAPHLGRAMLRRQYKHASLDCPLSRRTVGQNETARQGKRREE
ncbi:hypothetical protein GQ53DRAFT_189880 [Thozetella sp. PMI_491]|nr:hypothetical protein GQ53DRAFT_189880 [Thozetella sp. PMI_491]